jgi:hypothetical protein
MLISLLTGLMNPIFQILILLFNSKNHPQIKENEIIKDIEM